MKVFISYSLLILTWRVAVSESAKILGLFTTYSHSHLIIHTAIIQTLADRGHNVTIVTALPWVDPNKNYRHIQLNMPPFDDRVMPNIVEKSQGPISMLIGMAQSIDVVLEFSNTALNHPKMKKLMAEESFDLLLLGIHVNFFELGVAAHFKCPVVISFMNRPVIMINGLVGNPHELVYVPPLFTGTKTRTFDFSYRLKNVVGSLVENLLFAYGDYRSAQLYDVNFPADKYPFYKEMLKNVSLLFTCTHFSSGIVRPNVPAILEVEGVQIKPQPNLLSHISSRKKKCK